MTSLLETGSSYYCCGEKNQSHNATCSNQLKTILESCSEEKFSYTNVQKTCEIKKPFRCKVCGAGFTQKYHLQVHARRHTGERPYKCKTCGLGFPQSSSLRVHERTHTGAKPYKCNICGKAFSYSSHLHFHNRIHTGEKPYKCNVCGMNFSRQGFLKCHMRIHTGERPYVCEICGAKFSRSGGLLQHTKIHTRENLHRCEVCGMEFVQKTTLKEHQRRHTGEKPYRCDVCGISFARRFTLKIHKTTHTGEKNYKCSVCDAAFCHRGTLIRHKQTHAKEALSRKEADVHDTVRTSSEMMSEPTMKEEPIDLSDRPAQMSDIGNYPCGQCNVSFSDPVFLVSHVEMNHSVTCLIPADNGDNENTGMVDKPDDSGHLVCEGDRDTAAKIKVESASLIHLQADSSTSIKDSSLGQSETNESHQDLSRCGDQQQGSQRSRRMFVCKYCGEEFLTRAQRQEHKEEFHTGDKPYKCNICGVGFARNTTRKIHMRTHTGEKIFKCSICGQGFGHRCSLLRHERRHAKEIVLRGESVIEAENEKMTMDTIVKEEPADQEEITSSGTSYCGQCFIAFPHPTLLDKHVQMYHRGGGLSHPDSDANTNELRSNNGGPSKDMSENSEEKNVETAVCDQNFLSDKNIESGNFRYFRSGPRKRIQRADRPFKCDICGRGFSYSSHLQDHIRTHTGEKPYKCGICGMDFPKNSRLQEHSRTHTGEKPFKCDVCNVGFARNSTLKIHKRTHTGEKMFKCSLCGAGFAHRGSLQRHERKHGKDTSPRIDSRNSESENTVNEMMLSSEVKEEVIDLSDTQESMPSAETYFCAACCIAFSSAEFLDEHVKREHTAMYMEFTDVGLSPSVVVKDRLGSQETDNKNDVLASDVFRDPALNEDTTSEEIQTQLADENIQSGNSHEFLDSDDQDNGEKAQNHDGMKVSSHPVTGTISEREKLFKCEFCSKEFHFGSQLKNHRRTHTGEKPFKCDICGMAFSRTSFVKTHRRKHTGEKPYQCGVCGSSFARSGDLQQHTRIHTRVNLHKCDICGLECVQKSTLIEHTRSHTGEKPYKCDECDSAFARSSTLKIHKRTHTGEKLYSCKFCGLKFSQGGNLQKHERIHSKEKPYKCDICGTAFASRDILTTHTRTHTGEKPYKCDVCGLGFAQHGVLVNHKRTHTGEKRHACDLCGARFADKRTLQKHERKRAQWGWCPATNPMNTKEKRFACEVCGVRFAYKHTLQKHERKRALTGMCPAANPVNTSPKRQISSEHLGITQTQ